MIDKIARRVIEKIAMEEATMGQASGVQAAPMSGAAAETASKAEPIVQKAGPGLLRRGFNMATAPIRFAGRMATAPLRFAARHPFLTAGAGLAGAGAVGLRFGHLANQGAVNRDVLKDVSNSVLSDASNNPLRDLQSPESQMMIDASWSAINERFKPGNINRDAAITIADAARKRGGWSGAVVDALQSGARSLSGDPAGMMSKIPVK